LEGRPEEGVDHSGESQNSVTYSYVAFGLNLESKAAIHGLEALPVVPGSRANGHIEVVTGTAPAWVEGATRLPATLLYSAGPIDDAMFHFSALGEQQFFRFSYRDGTQFVVDAKTERIWGNCLPPLTSEDLHTYLLGPVMGFVLRWRGILALHASCFCLAGQAFALCGGPGAGKSTTSAALALQGVPVLCEDIAALRDREGRFWAAPGYPRVNLWPESAVNLFGPSVDLPKITPNWEKQFLPLDGKLAKFEDQERPLAAIYVLGDRHDAPDAPRMEEVSARDAALLIVQNTYANHLLAKDQRAAEFEAATRLASCVAVKRLVPSSDPARIPALCDLLKADAARSARAVATRSPGTP
jgi:hypothetical protein